MEVVSIVCLIFLFLGTSEKSGEYLMLFGILLLFYFAMQNKKIQSQIILSSIFYFPNLILMRKMKIIAWFYFYFSIFS